MFKLQLQWKSEGDWLDTVWKLPYDQALAMVQKLSYLHQEHNYRIIPTLVTNDTPLFDEVYGG